MLKTFILLAFGLFLFTRVTKGVITYYINERFVLATLLAASGFIVVGYSVWELERKEDDDHGHDHGQLTWLGWLIVAMPLLLGWLVPPQPLRATAVANREFNMTASNNLPTIPALGQTTITEDTLGWNLLDWHNAFQQHGFGTFYGQEAQLTGFVYRDDRFADDTFMVSRFMLSCCVADASPVGLLVRWPETAVLSTDQWVEVHGFLEAGSFDGISMPILNAEQVTPIAQPPQPYLYP
jgi:uncharacterized repeat protein (TIGR03943 family)